MRVKDGAILVMLYCGVGMLLSASYLFYRIYRYLNRLARQGGL
jgi:hypothetical protein